MRISDWSSDVCSSDLHGPPGMAGEADQRRRRLVELSPDQADREHGHHAADEAIEQAPGALRCEQWRQPPGAVAEAVEPQRRGEHRSEEHTSELQSLMRISYAVFCLKKKNDNTLCTGSHAWNGGLMTTRRSQAHR